MTLLKFENSGFYFIFYGIYIHKFYPHITEIEIR